MTLVPHPFCRGVPGREACSTCAGKLQPGQQPLREDSAHEPWPFEPCPHYCHLLIEQKAAA